MNYDAQYAFSHGVASTPQFQTLQQQHLQPRQQHQQVFPQQQYSQIASTSNIFYQFSGGSNPVFQQKDIQQMALPAGGMQQAPLGTQHGMVASSFVKQGVPVRMEGNCVHLVGRPEGMIYQQQPQQPDLKIITANPDARMLQQHTQLDSGLGITQNTAATLLGLDMMRGQPQHILEQSSLDMSQAQHQGIAMAGQSGMLSYSKHQQFPGPWLQPQQQQQVNNTNNLQQQQQAQSALPSFTHLWSQFQQQKNQAGLGIQQQQQAHLNTFQQPQQLSNHLQQQHQQILQQQPFAAASNFQTMTSMQMIKMPNFQEQSQQPSPLTVQPNQISVSCFSSCKPSNTSSPNVSLTARPKVSASQSTFSVNGISPQHPAPSLLTDSSTIPPKVTVILDSLPHCETFPPTTIFKDNAASKMNTSPVISCVDSSAFGNRHQISSPNSQHHFHQKKPNAPRHLKAISSTGSSTERSSSESSNFSSPPYTFTPPSSNDSLFSLGIPALNSEELSLPATIQESLSSHHPSSAISASRSPTLFSSSPHENSLVVSMPSAVNTNVKTEGNSKHHLHGSVSVSYVNSNPLSTVATVLSLSSPSTTTVITAMASSHQLVTTTTTTTSVTLASHCLIDSAATSIQGCSSRDPKTNQNVNKLSASLNNRNAKNNILKNQTPNTTLHGMEKKIKVPLCWHRKLDNGAIVYLSPSGTALQSYEQICQYLLSDSTCKCGLECPIQVEEFFNFDPSVVNQAWAPDAEDHQDSDKDGGEGNGEKQRQEDLRKLCNHRRELLALAALHTSQTQMATESTALTGKKRDRKKSLSGGEGLILSPLKRLKTSITNAVNRHAVSSSKRKNCVKTTPENLDSKPRSDRHDLEKCIDVSTEKAVLEYNQETGEENTKITPAREEKSFSQFEKSFSGKAGNRDITTKTLKDCQDLLTSDFELREGQQPTEQTELKDATSPLNQGNHVGDVYAVKPLQVLPPSPSSPSFHKSLFPQQIPEGKQLPMHSTPINQSPSYQSWLEPDQHNKLGSPKTKPKRLKTKREKQRTMLCSDNATEDMPLPPNTVSFLENPTVFVAQQTVMINNSIASCNIAYSSPGPTTPIPSSMQTMAKSDRKMEVKEVSSQKQELTIKEEEEERKTGTDTDSNRSFSDTTENNDSAYLSQTGSDQERSDTIDGSDSCLDTSKALDIYDFNCSEEKESGQDASIVHVNVKSLDFTESQNFPPVIETSLESKTSKPAKDKNLSEKTFPVKTKPKAKTLSSNIRKDIQPKTGVEDPPGRDCISSLNKDLSNLLASDNWNIPAVQQVLAQYSGGDPGLLNAAIQQVLAQASTAGIDFPAGNLLTAAAQVQCKGGSKKPLNGMNYSTALAPNASVKNVDRSVSQVCGVQNAVSSSLPASYSQAGKLMQQKESPVVSQPAAVMRNVVQLSQGTAGGISVNMMVPLNSQGPQQSIGASVSTSDVKASDPKGKAVATLSPLVSAQNIQGCNPVNTGPKLGIAVPSATPSSLAQGPSGGNAMILNGFGTPHMIMNSQMPPVSVSMVTTTVTKTLSQMTIGLNQAVFGAASAPTSHLPPPNLLVSAPQQQQQQSTGSACILNASHHQIVKPAGSNGQAPPMQVANTQHIMNTLSVQGLNPSQQLLLQQMSPCNPISQLSPAMAAQILTQNQQQQQLQQVSPSFLAGNHQLQKLPQGSVLGNQTSIFASVPLPTFSAAPATSNCSGLFTQASILPTQQQQQQRSGDGGIPGLLSASVDSADQLAHSLSQVKDVAAAGSLANASMFAATSQPVFVIPQANANPVVQVLGSTPSLTQATDLNVQQQTANNFTAQLLGQQQQSQQATFDPSQLPNLLSAGFNPLALQQTINAVNLSGVQQQQQQQQQLQMLQLQQLMLQQFQNQQNQSLQGISIPGPQAAPQTIVNAVMPTQNLHLNSVMDVNAIHPSLSPVAATAAAQQNLLNNQLPPAQLHITSSIGAQTIVPGNAPAVAGVLQSASLQKMSQAPVKTICSVTSSQPQVAAVTAPSGNTITASAAVTTKDNLPQKLSSGPAAQQDLLPSGPCKALTASTPPASSGLNPTSPANSSSKAPTSSSKSSKSKSKSKKSEAKKPSDPESERNEEDIAATVQQILAQAVQQQRELNLAAKNQPPPPPKSKSKKSQSRSRANANQVAAIAGAPPTNKEHDLGKLPSIMSDDVVIHKPEQVVLSGSGSSNSVGCTSSVSVVSPSLIKPPMSASSFDPLHHPNSEVCKSSQVLQQPPLPSSRQTAQYSSVGSTVSPVRTAQSSQSVEAQPLVISSLPQHIIYQAGSLPEQVCSTSLQENGAVVSDINGRRNCLANPSGQTVITNKSLVASPGSTPSPCCSSKKSAISLKDHLSSIISKDKDNSKKKASGSPSAARATRVKEGEGSNKAFQMTSLAPQIATKVEPVVSPKVLRKSLK
ncbi:methyl-cpg-binding domain protein 6 [Plakobranchus ocellatus]|uniref:Methyl-cpg-binding domain protein 6 n=1 Tax=Plakobranchus ocellatus TaxID=259542 RepID=A0AAV3ZCQ2_9GAST|nr:methyl-cpg-binding domain protein 6 [Plakobranchus ocellatus]